MRKILNLLIYIILVVVGIVMVFPFIWMLFSAFKTPAEIQSLPPTFLPQKPTLNNFRYVLSQGLFLRWYMNSLIVALVVTVSVALFASLSGYALAKFRFPGRKFIFIGILSTMMVPLQMLIIPWYIACVKLSLVDTYLGIAFPGLISAFGVFLMRQFMLTLPDDLLDAARIDGASELRIFFTVVIPLVKPALATLAIFTFISNWDAFLWPLIITSSPSMRTLPVGLQFFADQFGVQFHYIMAASALVVLPVFFVFFVLQRQIIRGVTLSGLKQ